MAQTFYPITPVEVTPGTAAAWTDVNVSAYVPAGATGVILQFVNSGGSSREVGTRKNGSTDARDATLSAYGHNWAFVGVDAFRIFEASVESITEVDLYLTGYTVAGVTFFTNAYDKSLTTLTTWTDINATTEAPSAIGLIFEVQSGAAWDDMGLRKNGSSDNRIDSTYKHDTFGAIIGCDAAQIVEGYIEDDIVDFFLMGYVTDGATFNTNATNYSLSTTGDWVDLSALPANSVMGFFEIAGGDRYGLRRNGDTLDTYGSYLHQWAAPGCDASYIVEGQIDTTAVDFFLVGYATAAAVAPTLLKLKMIPKRPWNRMSRLYKSLSLKGG